MQKDDANYHSEAKNKIDEFLDANITQKSLFSRARETAHKEVKYDKNTFRAQDDHSKELQKIARKLLDTYEFFSDKVPVKITISKAPTEFTPLYQIEIPELSAETKAVLDRLREELIKQVTLGIVDITDRTKKVEIEEKFKQTISFLVSRYFPDVEEDTRVVLISYLIQRSLGMGQIEILLDDDQIEEIAINNMNEPVWVYHKKHGWLSTNIRVKDEEQIKHYASMIARKVGRQISSLVPILDAHLEEGDRVNATLSPLSTKGNTITIRKFSRDPWTITKFLENNTISPSIAALMWQAIQFEISGIVAGGTASGKTSTLNVMCSFFPPNQRIISIEDTRELSLPKYLHWIPLVTRQPNPEGVGLITMEDLLVNSLRMRPDRVIVGEVRRKEEAQTLFEAIHTGHSVYSTFHANNAREVITRFTNPPIEVPKTMIPGLGFIISQFRNRRTGIRRTFEFAEVTDNCDTNNIIQYDPRRDTFSQHAKSKILLDKICHFSGFTKKELQQDLKEKEFVLKYLVKKKIEKVNDVGLIIAKYFTDKEALFKEIKNAKLTRKSGEIKEHVFSVVHKSKKSNLTKNIIHQKRKR